MLKVSSDEDIVLRLNDSWSMFLDPQKKIKLNACNKNTSLIFSGINCLQNQ